MKLFNIPETVKIETKASDDITEAIKAFKRKKSRIFNLQNLAN
jgi:hypothetical protein